MSYEYGQQQPQAPNYDDEPLDLTGTVEDRPYEYKLLPEGDYPYTVINMEKKYFNGSDKATPCQTAEVTLRIPFNGETVDVRQTFWLKRRSEGVIFAFFRSMGFQSQNGKIAFDFTNIIGCKGMCHIYHKPDSKKPDKKYNSVDKWLEPQPQAQPQGGNPYAQPYPQPAPQPAYQQPAPQQYQQPAPQPAPQPQEQPQGGPWGSKAPWTEQWPAGNK